MVLEVYLKEFVRSRSFLWILGQTLPNKIMEQGRPENNFKEKLSAQLTFLTDKQ